MLHKTQAALDAPAWVNYHINIPEWGSNWLTAEELAASPQAAESYLDHVQADGTSASYSQLVAIRIMGEQFYLHWHAGYNDTRIVCDRAALEAVLNYIGSWGQDMPLADKIRARRIDLEPVIALGTDPVSVQIVTFTDWGGFFRQPYTLQRAFPHTILDIESEELVPYDCGIMF